MISTKGSRSLGGGAGGERRIGLDWRGEEEEDARARQRPKEKEFNTELSVVGVEVKKDSVTK